MDPVIVLVVLIPLPLFILMGNFLGATPVGSSLFTAAVRWLNWLRGSLAISSVGASAMFGVSLPGGQTASHLRQVPRERVS